MEEKTENNKEFKNKILSFYQQNKKKIYFIHMNHTNPLLIDNSKEKNKVYDNGFNIAVQGSCLFL